MHKKKHLKNYDLLQDKKKDKSLIDASDELLHGDFAKKNMHAKMTFGW